MAGVGINGDKLQIGKAIVHGVAIFVDDSMP